MEVLPQILPVEDAEIAGLARKQFEKQGMRILTDATVTKLAAGAGKVTATIEAKGGKALMPAFDMLPADELDAMAAYLESLQ